MDVWSNRVFAQTPKKSLQYYAALHLAGYSIVSERVEPGDGDGGLCVDGTVLKYNGGSKE